MLNIDTLAVAGFLGTATTVARLNERAVAIPLACIAALFPLLAVAAGSNQVLVLHSFGREFAPYDAIVSAFRTELAKQSNDPLAVFDASLDAGQAYKSDDPRPYLELLRRRFQGKAPGVVVTIGPPAAAFYLQNRDQLFPRTPAVIAALDERFVRSSDLRTGDAAVASRLSLPDLVSNILRVLPDTQKIAVVIGDTPLERFWLGELRKQFAPFANRVGFEWLNNLSLTQMRQRVATLPPHSAVLYTLLISDAAGVPHERRAALASLVEVSSAPIFSLYESELGHGVVGGPLDSEQREGVLVAAATLRALSGGAGTEPQVQIVDNQTPVYDWRELKRWGIAEARLPDGSAIRFRPPAFWDEHRTLIIATASIIVLQTVSLIGLSWQRIRRRRAEGEALSLSGRLITAHEDERRWLARELHDDITQRLAGLAIDTAKLSSGDATPSDLNAGRSIHGELVRLSEDIHNLSYRLHPSVIDDLGLVDALKAECGRFARMESVKVDIHADGLPPKIPSEVALCLYRIAQEALRNVGRHAHATTVQLTLALSLGGLRLAVSDDGAGFEPGLPHLRPSLGHASMRERIRSLGGKLDIRSASGMGTAVIAWVPITGATA